MTRPPKYDKISSDGEASAPKEEALSRPRVPAVALQLHQQAVQAYQSACGLARSGKTKLASQAFVETYRLVAAATAAREAAPKEEEK